MLWRRAPCCGRNLRELKAIEHDIEHHADRGFCRRRIGPEVTEQAVRVLEALGCRSRTGRRRCRRRGLSQARPSAALGDARHRPLVRCHPVRRGRRFRLDSAGAPPAARAGHSRPAQGTGPVRQPAPGARVRRDWKAHLAAPRSRRTIDLLIVRELNGDVYFGEKGMRTTPDGRREGYDIMSYAEDEVRRIARTGFDAAMGRQAQAVLGRQGQCARNLAALARRGDRVSMPNTPKSSSATCMSTTRRCSWSRAPASST
jgi:hypothetical protein